MKAAAVILAGGRSSRMGCSDKPLLKLDDRPIVAHVIDRLKGQCELVAINANGDPDRYQSFALPIVADEIGDFAGPLAGILAGLIWADAQGATRLVTVAGDTPFFPPDLVERLTYGLNGGQIAVASSGGRWHPTFGSWPLSIAADLRAYLAAGGRKVTAFIERHPHSAVEFGPSILLGGGTEPFFNINTPDDLAEARRLVRPTGT